MRGGAHVERGDRQVERALEAVARDLDVAGAVERARDLQAGAELRELRHLGRVEPQAHAHRVDGDDAQVDAHPHLGLEVGGVVAAHPHAQHAQDVAQRLAGDERAGRDVERVAAARVEHRERDVLDPAPRRRLRVPRRAHAHGLVARDDRLVGPDLDEPQVEGERRLDVEQDAHLRGARPRGVGRVGDAVGHHQLAAAQDHVARGEEATRADADGRAREHHERHELARRGRRRRGRGEERRECRDGAEHVDRRLAAAPPALHLREPVEVALHGAELGRGVPRRTILGHAQPHEEGAHAVP
jgi:hypothetical protein